MTLSGDEMPSTETRKVIAQIALDRLDPEEGGQGEQFTTEASEMLQWTLEADLAHRETRLDALGAAADVEGIDEIDDVLDLATRIYEFIRVHD